MPDRTANWGDPADPGTKYRTQDDDPAGGGNFVVAEDLDGNTVLLQWNPTAGQWEYGGPVDLGGNDLSGVGTASVDALEAGNYQSNVRFPVFCVEFQGETQSTETSTGSFEIADKMEFTSIADLSELVSQSAKVECKLILQSGNKMETTGDYKAFLSTPSQFRETEIINLTNAAEFGITNFVEIPDGSSGATNIAVEYRSNGTDTISIKKAALQFYATLS